MTVLVSIAIATLLDTPHPITHAARWLVFAPTVVPLVASAMIWLWMFNSDHGLVNSLLGWIGIAGPNWLQERGWAMAALIILSVWSVGQAVVIYLAALRDVPSAQLDAAALDGMGPIRRFTHVVLPTIAPAVLFNTIIQTITAW